MKMIKQSVTPVGAAGSASGTAAYDNYHGGRLYAVYLDYAAGVTSTTDVNIKMFDPPVSIFTSTNNATDGWFFPRYRPRSMTGMAFTIEADSGASQLPVVGPPYLVVAQSSPTANAVTAYLFIEED
jgi:hypothetical protein